MKHEDICRESLFAMVWEHPATEVARELELSDVALGKLCYRLQVPKPPRGYWARIKAGQTPRRPPLPAFREQNRQARRDSQRRRFGPQPLVRLSKMQRSYIDLALAELTAAGTDCSGCKLGYDGIRAIGSGLAAKLLVLIQHRYTKWLDQVTTTSRSWSGGQRSIGLLAVKLLPLAKEQIVIFEREKPGTAFASRGPAIVLRLSAQVQQRIARVYHLVCDNKLSYAVCQVGASDHARSLQPVHGPHSNDYVDAQLCVSPKSLWFACTVKSSWDETRWSFDTQHHSIHDLLPADLLPAEDVALPASVSPTILRPYEVVLAQTADFMQ